MPLLDKVRPIIAEFGLNVITASRESEIDVEWLVKQGLLKGTTTFNFISCDPFKKAYKLSPDDILIDDYPICVTCPNQVGFVKSPSLVIHPYRTLVVPAFPYNECISDRKIIRVSDADIFDTIAELESLYTGGVYRSDCFKPSNDNDEM
jgi:hypothetical protein